MEGNASASAFALVADVDTRSTALPTASGILSSPTGRHCHDLLHNIQAAAGHNQQARSAAEIEETLQPDSAKRCCYLVPVCCLCCVALLHSHSHGQSVSHVSKLHTQQASIQLASLEQHAGAHTVVRTTLHIVAYTSSSLQKFLEMFQTYGCGYLISLSAYMVAANNVHVNLVCSHPSRTSGCLGCVSTRAN